MGRRIWTDELILDTIRALHQAGVDLSPTSIQRTHSVLFFSSARSKSHPDSWRPEEVVKALREAHQKGEDLLSADFKHRYKSLHLAARSKRCFGSWRRAIEKAGLDYEKLKAKRFWTKNQIIKRIGELHAQGVPLHWSKVDKISPGLYRAARRKENFGS